jgi:hypothetical protein
MCGTILLKNDLRTSETNPLGNAVGTGAVFAVVVVIVVVVGIGDPKQSAYERRHIDLVAALCDRPAQGGKALQRRR